MSRTLLAARVSLSAVLHDLFSGGTFTRPSEGSYLTGAPTDGSSAFLAWALANARRIENRGDGLGDMLLMEGSRENLVLQSRDLASATWSKSGTPTYDVNAGPDGSTLADQIVTTTGQLGAYQGVVCANVYHAISAWMRSVAGSQSYGLALSNGSFSSAPFADSGTHGTAWARRGSQGDITVTAYGATPTMFPAVGAGVALGAFYPTAAARDQMFDLVQLEVGPFPSSPIRTVGAATTRDADALTYTVGQYPASFLTSGFRITVAPDFSSAEVAAGGIHALVGVTPFTSGEVAIYQSGGIYLGVRKGDGSGTEFTTSTVSWSRGQLLTIEVRPGVSLVTSGFTTGNGTTALTGGAWASATLSIARRSDGTFPFFGRFGRYIEAL